MAISLLDREIYSYSDVDRLGGVHPGTALRWLDGYTRAGKFYQPVLRPERTGRDAVTWGELVEARLLAEFRDKRVSVQRMRPAIDLLRKEFGAYPLAHARPWLDVEGRELVRRVQTQVGLDDPLLLVVVRRGQLMLADETARFRDSVRYDAGVVSTLTPSSTSPDVKLDPARAFGQPTIRSVRTETLAEDFRAGATREELVDLYDLSADQVDQAIHFELIAGRPNVA